MNTFKKPETLLALSSFMGVIGVTIYFYRQQLLMKKTFDGLSDNVGTLSKTVGEMKVYGTQLATMSRVAGKIKDENDKLRLELAEQTEVIDELKTMLESVIFTLEENGTELKSPQPKVQFKKGKAPAKSALKQAPPQTKKTTKKVVKPVESEEDEDDQEQRDDDQTEDEEVDDAINSVRYNSTRR